MASSASLRLGLLLLLLLGLALSFLSIDCYQVGSEAVEAVIQRIGTSPRALLGLLRAGEGAKACPDLGDASLLRAIGEPERIDSRQCVQLPSNSTDFHLRACPILGAHTCNSFAIIINAADRTSCERVATSIPDSAISADVEEAQMLKRQLGPYHFQVSIDGSQRLAKAWPDRYDEHACEWSYNFAMSTGGAFQLTADLVYDQFMGFREVWEDQMGPSPGSTWPEEGVRAPFWPPLIDRSLFAKPVQSSALGHLACPSSCATYTFDSDKALLPALARPELPVCLRTEPVAAAFFPDTNPVHNERFHPIPVPSRGTPIGCRFDEKQTRLLTPNLPPAERESCLAGPNRTLVVHGDSHMRFFFASLLSAMQGGSDPDFSKTLYKEHVAGSYLMQFIWDPYLRGDSICTEWHCTVVPHEADILIVGAGAHQASLHLSTAVYLQNMREHAVRIAERTRLGKPTLWISSPAIRPYSDQYAWDWRDWRTNYRLAHWAKLGSQIAAEAGAMVIDGFSTSLPFDRAPPDNIHYWDLPPEELWLRSAAHMLQFCGSATP